MVEVFDTTTGKLRSSQLLSDDIGAMMFAGDGLTVGLSDGELVMLKVK